MSTTTTVASASLRPMPRALARTPRTIRRAPATTPAELLELAVLLLTFAAPSLLLATVAAGLF